ncbi:MAG: hypothetical protein LW698_03810 [Planctomycetaceae bacterium]|nr:hypothetical protein [Planctomycetaceae bacterium]
MLARAVALVAAMPGLTDDERVALVERLAAGTDVATANDATPNDATA